MEQPSLKEISSTQDLARLPANGLQRARPLPVTLVAIYEFAKAAYIVFVFQSVWSLHKANLAAGLSDSDPISHDPFVVALPVFVILLVVAGFGLWMLQPWARHLFLVGGALSLPWLPILPLRAQIMWGPFFDYRLLQPYMPQAVMTTMFVIDLLVYATLVLYPDVAGSFGETSGDPYYSGGPPGDSSDF